MDNLIGKKLDGRYLLEQLIGTGGMANVYKATDLLVQRTVAVKILREEFMTNEDLVRRFKNESKAISLLNHPNIVKVYDVSVSDKIQYIVMELLDGINLKEYIDQRREKLTWKETLHFITQILSAISHAHERGIVHRDLKPQNIMLLQDGSIKVMDFGIARFSRSESRTLTDKAMGSVHYISPEQAKGDVTDLRADIYSIGVMMYEMLTARLPFESDSAVSVAIKQISDEAVPPRRIRPEIPEGLEAITMKAMRKEPADRYQSAAEMLADIAEFKQNPSVHFAYKYLEDNSPTRYIDKVVSESKPTASKQGQNAQSGAKKPPQKKKPLSQYTLPILAGMAVAFALGATILIFMIFKFSGNPLFNNVADVELPDFTGMNYEEIMAKVKSGEYKFDFQEPEYTYKADIPAGVVYDQSPKAPKTVKENSKVTLRVSRGVQSVTVPSTAGLSRNEAEKSLTSLDLNVKIEFEEDDTVPLNVAIRTDPAAGSTMSSGDTIVLYISKEKVETEVIVPELRGITNLSEVDKVLKANKLTLGTTTTEESELPEGTVISQTPAAGSKAKVYSKVNVLVSKGITSRTVQVIVKFNDSVNTAEWKTLQDEQEISTFYTTDGQVASWAFDVTGAPNTEVHLRIYNDKGASYNVYVNTAATEVTQFSFGGTYTKPENDGD